VRLKTVVQSRLLNFTVLIAFLFCLGCRDKAPRDGEPILSLSTYSGDMYTVSRKDDKVTLIVFWATWCQPCLMEIPTLIELQGKYGSRGFRVVAVNIDDPEGNKARAILEKFGVNYPVVMGNERTIDRFGGLSGIPTSILIGRDGMIKDKIEGLAPPEILEGKIVAQL
jgi:thiol-disulfide isomerase/thioredoxin